MRPPIISRQIARLVTRSHPRQFFLIMWCVLSAFGCSSIGPPTVNRDRSDYVSAISESWKQQTLLNIVKLRYADAPVFLDIGQVISGYELEGTLSAGGTIGSKAAPGALGDFLNLGAGGRYLDRPTVTYAPLTGPEFIKTMMTPFPPGSIMFLIESGWPVDLLLQASTQAVNGLRNHKGGPNGHPPDKEFIELMELLRRIQGSGNIGIRVRREKDGTDSTLFIFQGRYADPDIARDVARVKELLRIDTDAAEFTIAYGAEAQSGREIALHTRSGYQVLLEFASMVSVPPEDIAHHRTYGATPSAVEKDRALTTILSIKSGNERASDTLAQVQYRGHWFWIDDRDFLSKRIFTFLMVLLTLSETGQKIQQPILTIRAN
jgi:hypothetical protein